MDFKDLNQILLNQCPGLLYSWFQAGTVQGHEFLIGDIQGGVGKSLKVNFSTGAWADFANQDLRGGDLISLYAAKEGLTQGLAAKMLSEKYGIGISKKPLTRPITKPPSGVAAPSMFHVKHGRPTGSWPYRNADGELLFLIARYDTPDGKIFWPWCWDGEQWVPKHWPSPRPLYGLEFLSEDSPVVLVEGEKACHAARNFIPEDKFIVMTWPGGASGYGHVDWKPLYGRKVLIWPDNDKDGLKAGNAIAAKLSENGCTVKIIDVTGEPDKADAADYDFDWEKFKAWSVPKVNVYKPEVSLNTRTADRQETDSPQVVTNILSVGEEVLDLPMDNAALRIWSGLGVKINRQGTVTPSADNVLRALEGLDEFKEFAWFDEFHMRFYTTWKAGNCKPTSAREWTDGDDLELMVYFQRHLALGRVTVQTTNHAFQIYCGRRVKNEPKDWVLSLKWDKTPRIAKFLEEAFGANKTGYTRAASCNFWISMVARLMSPGCKVDNMLVLEGSQGIYKSEALKCIAGAWFAEAFQDLHNKDFFLSLQGRLITEIGELDAFSRSDTTTIKRMLSCQVDRYRPPYGRASLDYPRQGIFVGSTNKDDWNRDDTGARRFWPIAVHEVNLDYIKANREQLFAEALNYYQHGATWWEMPREEAEKQQEFRRQSDPWEPIIEQYLIGKDLITVNEILTECLQIEKGKLDKAMQMRVANCLRLSHFKKKDSSVNGSKGKFWGRKVEVEDKVEDRNLQ